MTDAIDALIRREGGYVNHPADRGGPTKYGVTQRTLSEYLGTPVTAADVEALTIDEARRIYLDRYVEKWGYDKIKNAYVRDFVVDAAVLHGPRRASEWLQSAVGAKVDGIVGPRTLELTAQMNPRVVVERIAVARLLHLTQIVAADASQAAFLKGWFTRVVEQIL